ncbi:xanthine dehydrogenase family protein subunit M [Metallosphaera tengchongensis]|uniref:Xanthine dehydrogenase family protein subunit M n=1 Tax=Metallosphaera tengchongensis TaxID=1532350 RepID=A0A6N0NXG0_9CREN|nr:glyceraldehyde dehydrogenase subunit beta [Metallosphaera tengchongensis]QKR00553.1 xanthine dehydrogenase family protein subunit M [Metallosphaera tengchongensis]
MYPPKFGYVIPDSLDEANEFLETHEDAKALAGGHSLIPMLKLRILRPSYLVELKGLNDLHYMRREAGKIHIGALTTHYEILKGNLPLLSEAASTVADPQVRNMGTIGGVISHLDPAADYPASLIAMDATVKIKGTKGEREVPFKDFAKDMFSPDLAPGELVKEVITPEFAGYTFSYKKLERRAGDYAIVGVAVLMRREGDVVKDLRIGLTAVNNKAVRALEAEKVLLDREPNEKLIEEAAEKAMGYANPTSDIRGSAEYKKKMTKVMTKRALLEALKR